MSENYNKNFSYIYHSQIKNCKKPYSFFLINLNFLVKNNEQNMKDCI